MHTSGADPDVSLYRTLDGAFREGNFAVLRAPLAELDGFPNVIAHPAIGACLTYAIFHSPLPFIADLLEAGADPNWPNDDGFPPLIAALSCADSAPGAAPRCDVHELLGLLLAHGADVAQRGLNDFTPLHWAAGQGDLTAVDMLLAHGADPNATTRIDDVETALEVAEAAGHAAVVDRLAPLTTGPAWERVSKEGDVREMRRLLRDGVSIDATDGYGQTALMRSAHAGQIESVRWLIANGADLDRTAKFHLSALMLAVIGGHPRISRLLAAAGADVTTRGRGAPGFHDKTAADLAEERGDKRLTNYLRTRQ